MVFVPEQVGIAKECGVVIHSTPYSHRYNDEADMLVLLLPTRKTINWHHMPWTAKEFRGRLALYWLKPEHTPCIEVVWALPKSDVDAKAHADDINHFVEDERGEIPNFTVDNYKHYDIVLSYASEDRMHARKS